VAIVAAPTRSLVKLRVPIRRTTTFVLAITAPSGTVPKFNSNDPSSFFLRVAAIEFAELAAERERLAPRRRVALQRKGELV